MQANSTGNMHIYNTVLQRMGVVDSKIVKDEVLKFFLYYGKLYILLSSGLIEVTYINATNSLILSYVQSILPINAYKLVIGPLADILYV